MNAITRYSPENNVERLLYLRSRELGPSRDGYLKNLFSLRYPLYKESHGTIFKVAIDRIDAKHPNWPQHKKAKLCFDRVTDLLVEAKYFLTYDERSQLGLDRNDFSSSTPEELSQEVRDLSTIEKVYLAELISVDRANALIQFFDLIVYQIPEKDRLALPRDIPEREQAQRIRTWIRENLETLLAPNREYDFHPINLPIIPVEAAMFFPKFNPVLRDILIKRMIVTEQKEPIFYLMKYLPNQPIFHGKTNLTTIFEHCCLLSNPVDWNLLYQMITNKDLLTAIKKDPPSKNHWFVRLIGYTALAQHWQVFDFLVDANKIDPEIEIFPEVPLKNVKSHFSPNEEDSSLRLPPIAMSRN